MPVDTSTGPARAIADVPEPIRQLGLIEAHSRPLASQGKSIDGPYRSKRVSTYEAWRNWAELELRTPNSWPGMVLDLDGFGAIDLLCELCFSPWATYPPPLWVITRRDSGNCHAVWLLDRPVLRGEKAQGRPLRFLAAISEWYASALGADAGFNGVLTHNPYDQHPYAADFAFWHNPESRPYALAELAEPMPARAVRKPPTAQARTEAGRNCYVFDGACRILGSPKNQGLDTLAVCEGLNAQLALPQLPRPEVAGIARSVGRYRREWQERGQFGEIGDSERKAWGQRVGRVIGARGNRTRQERAQARRRRVLLMAKTGHKPDAIAEQLGAHLATVYRDLGALSQTLNS
ncbi:MAG: hypothetical protein F4X02_14905 [Chloroflexi bacterium]|nr:hypothetical protein [Chloroflexota bacterium]